MKFFRRNLLLITVFITGGCVLIIEIVATRVLSPFYGNTIFTVSSVISVILAALSIGYYVGGKIADKHPKQQWFFRIILLSGLALLFLHFISTFALPILGYTLSISIGPLISSLLLFFIPALLLGTLSPYAVKLQTLNTPNQGVGSVAGRIFFWSTLGSILGSLSSGFILIPLFGINEIIIANGVILFFLGFLPLIFLGERKYLVQSVLTLIIILGLLISISDTLVKSTLYSKDGIYEKITIYDEKLMGHDVRLLQLDRGQSGSMFLDSKNPNDLSYEYTKYYSIYKILNPDIKNALVIGGGAYSIPKVLLDQLPNANIDVSEIEPTLYTLAKKYFNLGDNPRLHNYTEDGRILLHDSNINYDYIFSDVYQSLYSIPAHFTTKEFFEIAKNKLNQNGIFVANVIGSLDIQKQSFTMSEIKTFQTVFPNSYFFAVQSPDKITLQNIIFVGYKGNKNIDLNNPFVLSNPDPTIRSLKNKLIDIGKFDLSPYPPMTDDYSPVEYLISLLQK